MILWVSIIITVLFWIVAVKTNHSNDAISAIACILGIIGTVITFIFICAVISVRIPMLRNREYNRYQQRYNSITYALENNPESVRLLTTEISDYNSEVLNGRMMMDSKMFGILDYDFYYDLPLVDNSISK
jgi:uncharacterized membrane protein YgaE (UPF0421/DUF939 family)